MRSMVEGFSSSAKKPLHRTSCGPPPHEIVGRRDYSGFTNLSVIRSLSPIAA